MDISSNNLWQTLESRLLNVLQTYTDQILQEPLGPTTQNEIPRGEANDRPHQTADSEYEMLNDMIYYYSRNIRDYNTNIRELINRVEDYQTTRRTRTAHSNRGRSRYTSNYYNNRNTENPFRMYYHTQWIPINPLGTPLPVLLTREEIARATITYGFIDEMILRDLNGDVTNICPISLETLQVGDVICEIRGCGHKFKRPNLMTWLNRNSNCPVCRYNLRTPLPSEEPLTHEEHEEMEQDQEQDQDEQRDEDASGNQTSSDIRRLQASLSQIFQNVLQGVNVDSFSDGSSNLLYEFEIPIFNNTNPIVNNYLDNEIQDDQEVD